MSTLLEQIGTRLTHSRLGGALFGAERRERVKVFRLMERAYFQGPFDLPPEELHRQLVNLAETNPWQIQDILSQRAWEVIGYTTDTDAQRARAVAESIRLFRTNPLGQWSIWTWTSWGLGDRVSVTIPDNDAADETWQEFFTAGRNAHLFADDRIKELSRWLLVKGNRFVAFYTSTVDGETQVRLIDQDEMSFVTNPDDDTEIWFYKRTFTPAKGGQKTWYYPDWRLFFSDELEARWEQLQAAGKVAGSAIRADLVNSGEEELGDERPGTVAYVLFIPHNIKDEKSLWGWPLSTVAWPWANEHKTFMESRLTVAIAKAMFVRRKKVTGGSRQLRSVMDTVASKLNRSQYYDTNPPAPAGSVELDNRMIETTDLPMMTGASDASADNKMFSWAALLGYGLFPTTAGLDTARWATALEMDKAQSMLFAEYKTFWATQFKKVVRIVLLAKGKYGNANFGDYTVEVSIDSLSLADFPIVAETLASLVSSALTPLVKEGIVGAGEAAQITAALWRVSLEALGIEQAQSLAAGLAPSEKQGTGLPLSAQAGAQAGTGTGARERIAAVIEQNAEDGVIDWSKVAAWALEELRE